MKECEEEEKEVLIPLVKVLKNQEYCEWISKNDAEEAYLVLYEHDGLCWYHEGLIEQPHSIVLELSLNRVIEVNVDSHQLLRVNGEEVSIGVFDISVPDPFSPSIQVQPTCFSTHR